MSRNEELIRCEIVWNDEPDAEPETVIFAEHGTESSPVDELVFFTGYTADELRAAAGIPGDLGEDFTIVSVVDAAADIQDLV